MKNILVADFETTTPSKSSPFPEVYSWCVYGNDGKLIKYGIDIKTFYDYIRTIKTTSIMYFHNFAKFDGHFIVPTLSENGFRFMTEEDDPFEINKDDVSMLVNGNHHILEIKIGLPTVKKKGLHHTLKIRDSLKLFLGSIKSFGESLNEHYNTNEYTKGAIKYDRKEKYKSVKELEEDGNELEYLVQDCKILYEYLKLMSEKLPTRKWKISSASTAYNVWSDISGQNILDLHVNANLITPVKVSETFTRYKWKGKFKTFRSDEIKEQLFKRLFPTHWLDEISPKTGLTINYLYKWYKGGISGVHPQYKGVPLGADTKVTVVDINSSYPARMYNCRLPIGVPVKGDSKDPNYNLKLYSLKVKKTIKRNPDRFPIVGIMNGLRKNYPDEITPNMTSTEPIYLTDIELKVFLTNYNGNGELRKGKDYSLKCEYSFMSIDGKDIFGDYIDKFFAWKLDGKNEGDIGKVLIAKLMLNSLYGKFGTKSLRESRKWDDDDKLWLSEEETITSKFYLPIAIWITAYGRLALEEAIDNNYNHVVGWDTDSLFIIEKHIKKFKLDFHPAELGKWDIEKKGLTGVFRRSKQYMFQDEKDNYKYAFAGINMEEYDEDAERYLPNKLPTYDDFIAGTKIKGQKRPRRLPTGIEITEVEKTINPVWHYQTEVEDWFGGRSISKREESFRQGIKKQIKKVIQINK